MRPLKHIGSSRAMLPRLLLAATVIVVVGFAAICGAALLDMRRGDENLAREALGNLAASIDFEIARNLETYDLSLRGVVNNITLSQLGEVNARLRQMILFDQAATATHFGVLQVLDAAGNVTMESSTLNPVPRNFAGEDFFTIHQRDPLFGLYIGLPTLRDGIAGIALSRRLSGRDGSFLGVVSGFMQMSYFDELLGKLKLAPKDTITLIRQDGRLILRAPEIASAVGRDLSATPRVQRVLASLSGSYVTRSDFDDIERLYVWAASHRLIVIVGRATETIHQRWRDEAIWIIGAVSVIGLFACGGMATLVVQMRRRAGAELRLAVLALTDGLTGLGNRRRFDEALELEWRRAQRTQSSIVLLMIDVDNFKAFNDLHGHQAGDAALVGIAGFIGKSARRASDCAARYGGEEFAVLLPNLGFADALVRAESIRTDVASGSLQNITISIGVACMRPARDNGLADLLKVADQRLYLAKAAGRNRIYPAATNPADALIA